MNLSILYRGSLDSCNYACPYCPFGKNPVDRDNLRIDAQQLERFVERIAENPEGFRTISLFFTPWGEALIHRSYQRALVRLSHLTHVPRVAAQTNLSFRPEWLEDCDARAMGLWATYHPGEVDAARFARKSRRLLEMGIRHSVGVVGVREHFPAIRDMRAELSPDVYMWVNAIKRPAQYYDAADIEFLEGIDPHVRWNLEPHASFGRACRTGESVVSVDGAGEVRRCHFVPERLGNLYETSLREMLRPRACTNQECRCHIGYVHLEALQLDRLYGDGILERLPAAHRTYGAPVSGLSRI